MEKNKILLPISILLASIILGMTLYFIQIKKQEFTERQQLLKIGEDRKIENLKIEKDNEEKYFSNNLKCQSLLKELKQRWGNVVGIYYDSNLNTCIVKYTEKGDVQESPIEDMQDN